MNIDVKDARLHLTPGLRRFSIDVKRESHHLDDKPALWPRSQAQAWDARQKVYPTDQHIREFLGHSIHAVAAAAETPFLTTGLRADFRLGSPRSPGLIWRG